MIPGSRLMRMPWLSSAYSKPRSRISRSMARPSVWRCEFQQVESECIKKAECVCELDSTRPRGFDYLQIGIAGAQHGRKPGHLHFATAPFARLFIMPVVAHFLQDALAVDLFLQSPQRFFHRFALFKFDLCQRRFTSSPGPGHRRTTIDRFGLQVWGKEGSFARPTCQRAKSRLQLTVLNGPFPLAASSCFAAGKPLNQLAFKGQPAHARRLWVCPVKLFRSVRSRWLNYIGNSRTYDTTSIIISP